MLADDAENTPPPTIAESFANGRAPDRVRMMAAEAKATSVTLLPTGDGCRFAFADGSAVAQQRKGDGTGSEWRALPPPKRER